MPNLILLPRAAEELKIPFVASGGMADGRSLVAALALGADGMNMGTRFMATKEAPVHENVKQAIVAASELDTRLVMRPLRNTERVLKNAAVERLLEKEKALGAKIKFEDILAEVAGVYPRIMKDGEMDAGAWSCGMVAGLIHDVPTVQGADRPHHERGGAHHRQATQRLHAGFGIGSAAMAKHRIYTTSFAAVYPHYVAKAEKKGRTKGRGRSDHLLADGLSSEGAGSAPGKANRLRNILCKGPQAQPFASLDQRRGVRCPRGGHQGADHARNPLPGQTDRRAGAGKSDGQDLAKELILSDQPP